MLGRECLKCERYFKLKPGTGLPTDHCNCPYCEYSGPSNKFWTKDQVKYIESIAINQAYEKVIKPTLNKITNSFKRLVDSSRNSLIKFKVEVTGTEQSFPIEYYTEKELETMVVCKECGLHFSIYGVFSNCPDCKRTNAFHIYESSLEVIEKKLEIFSKPEIPKDIKESALNSILTSAISAFDGLGKELKKRKTDLYKSKSKNLFQNLYLLNKIRNNVYQENIQQFENLIKLFQVRHCIEHNMGVIDEDCTKKIPSLLLFENRKYILTTEELIEFLNQMKQLGRISQKDFENEIF